MQSCQVIPIYQAAPPPITQTSHRVIEDAVGLWAWRREDPRREMIKEEWMEEWEIQHRVGVCVLNGKW